MDDKNYNFFFCFIFVSPTLHKTHLNRRHTIIYVHFPKVNHLHFPLTIRVLYCYENVIVFIGNGSKVYII